jgi:hypothetical protein
LVDDVSGNCPAAFVSVDTVFCEAISDCPRFYDILFFNCYYL